MSPWRTQGRTAAHIRCTVSASAMESAACMHEAYLYVMLQRRQWQYIYIHTNAGRQPSHAACEGRVSMMTRSARV